MPNKLRHWSLTLCSALWALAGADAAGAQTGATLTPDRLSYVVNKDIGPDRWTINLNLSSDDPTRFINATGNVFKSDGSPPSFVLCQIRPESTGTLSDPSSTFRFTCKGTDACQTSATDCAQSEWRPIPGADDVQLGASFFLPPGGNGTPAARVGGFGMSRDLPAGVNPRGATLSLDGFNFLVNKDIGPDRWSISLNYVPVETQSGGTSNRLESVTGNVFKPDGSPPSFVYCTPRADSTGRVEDPQSLFRFACVGTDPCTTTASDCAQNDWRAIPGGDDVQIAASFFLPPEGLPAPPQSDPDIVVIGRTSDPPSIITQDFSLGAGSTAADRVAGGSCPVGQSCFARLGGCNSVTGRVVSNDSICGCLIENVPAECIPCDAGCGISCSFPVGASGSTARGTCLQFKQSTGSCICYAVGSGSSIGIDGCGGTLDAACPSGKCCTDDPRDGCIESSGNVSCPGICVDSEGCDPSREQCGICFAPEGGTGAFCGNNVREGNEQCDGTDLDGEDCHSQGFEGGGDLTCDSSCLFDVSGCLNASSCGNGRIDSGEQCDGRALSGETCQSLGYDAGSLECSSSCEFDVSHCSYVPQVTNVNFPSVIMGQDNEGSVEFADRDGDIVFARFDQVSGNISSFSFDPDVRGDQSGSFGFLISCTCSSVVCTPADFTLAVTLEDSRGNQSDPVEFSFQCQYPS
jgi:hypothetical protein